MFGAGDDLKIENFFSLNSLVAQRGGERGGGFSLLVFPYAWVPANILNRKV